MGYFNVSRSANLFIVLMTSGLLACGGGGSGGKKSAPPDSSTAALSANPQSSIAAVSSAVATSSTPAPEPIAATTLTLGAPTTNPIVIPPSATAVPVKFLSVVRGNYYPEQLLLDELDKDGTVVRASVAVLKDDGSGADAFRGDQIYSGQLLLGSVSSLEKSYRVHADHKGKDVVSGSGRFWVSGCPSVARPSNPDKAVLDITANAYVFADEVLVTLADTVAPELSEINALMAEAKGQVVGCIPALNQYLVELSDSSTAASLYAAIATLKSKTPQVLDASPNAVVLSPPSENASACDGQECQWYLERIRAPEAWALVGGGDQQMGVGVIDFGVDCTHTDINCNGSANSEDKIDHGTGVASLIAAHKGDGSAMVGVAWNTALYPFSFIGRGGSQYKMSELITLSMAEESIRVINISAATATDPSNQIRDAMCSAIDSGRLIVAAAGNASTANSCQLEKVYPARYNSTGACANGADLAKGLLVVGAIDTNNNLAQWENNSLCSNTLHVDVFAPGKDIYAASANNNGYAAKNGTSFSSPLVAGSAAVLWAAEPSLTVAQVHDKLVTTSVTYAKSPAAPDTSRNHTQDPRLEGKQLLDLFAAVGGKDTQLAPDLTPDAFTFTARTSAEFNTYINSERIMIKGIDASVPISIEGGFYAIDDAPFTSAAGSIGPNQTVMVQLLSANLPLVSRRATLTLGNLVQTFDVTTAATVAAQPGSFNFTDIANAELGSSVLSSPLTIAGLPGPVPISIVGGEYAIEGGAFTSANGTVSANQNVRLRVTAATIPDTSVQAIVTIGGVSDSFRVTTVAADTNPEPFVFTDSSDSVPNTLLTSNSITVRGINTEANISISGGEYAIDGGTYRAAAGKVQVGQTVTVRHKSASQFAADTYSALTIGGYTATFHSRTQNNTAPTVSNIHIQDLNGGNLEVGDSLLGTYTYVDADGDPEGASSYRWLRNGVVIANATSTTYVLVAADSGQDIRFEVTPVAVGGVIAGSVKESPATPVINSAPRISDLLVTGSSGVVGDTLRASYSYQDAENDPEGVSRYRWLRNGVAIAGATGANYQTVSNDAGQPLSVEVTPVALSGKLEGAAVVSSTLLLGNSAPRATNLAITGATAGKSVVGTSLTGTYLFADVDGDLEGTSRYRWLRNGMAISGATSRTYVVTAADSGQPLVFEVTPVAAQGTGQGAIVLSSAVVVNSVPSAQAVKVTDSNGGSLVVGDSLVGAYTYADVEGDAQGASRYRWLRNGTAIGGATALTYVLTSADSNQHISFEVTPVAVTGSVTGVAVQSVAVSINNSAPVATNVRIVDSNGGTAALGDTLNGAYSYSDLDANPQGATTFSWLRNGSSVSNSQTYSVTAADSGKTLQFKVTPRATAGVIEGAAVSSAILTVPSFVPNNFSFIAVTGAALNAVVTSNTVTISGINTAVPISIVNGQYAINGGAFTSAPGTIGNGQTLVVRVTASPAANTGVQAVLTVGGVASSFSVSTAAADTTPDAFSFPQVNNAAFGVVVSSTPITISGINTATTVSVTGGEYAINGGAFVSTAGTVSNGQTLTLRLTASTAASTSLQAVLTVGGVASGFSVTTMAADTIPDAFSFPPVGNAALGSVVTSAVVTVSGINTAAPINVTGGTYSINNGAFVSGAGTISNGQTLRVRVTAPAVLSSSAQALVNVGGVSTAFAVSTATADTTPDAFAFLSINNAELNSVVTSNSVVISGINTAAPISIVNGQYAINGGAFTSAAGTISNGQILSVKVVASATPSTLIQATVNVGGVAGNFTVGTVVADTSPNAFSFTAVTNAALSSAVTSNSITITGINTAAPISISNGHYSINGGAFINTPSTVIAGQTINIKVVASATPSATQQATLMVGGVTGSFSVTTQASDTTPDAFNFTAVTNAALNAVVISNTVTITGINAAAPISITNGQYSINGGAFTSIAGTVSNGQTVRVNLTSSANNNMTSQAALNVGNVSSFFRVTTMANQPPVIVPPGAITLNENTSQTSYIPSATDPEGDTFSFSLSGRDAGLFTLSASGELVFISPPNFEAPKDDDANNIYQLNLVATDSKGKASQVAVSISVKNETRHLKVDLLMPTPGSDVGRGTTTTTTVMCRFVDLESGSLPVTAATANGAPLAQTTPGSGIWFAKIGAVPGQNSLNISATIQSETTPLRLTSSFNNRGAMKSPRGLVIDQTRNAAFIIDGAHNALLKADLTTGHRQVISDIQTWPNLDVFWPGKMRLRNGNANLLVADSWGSGKLFDFNLTTGDRRLIGSGASGAAGVELSPAGTHALVANTSGGSIVKFDLTTGARTIAASSTVGAGDSLAWPYDIKASTNFDKYVVATQRPDTLLSFNPVSGDRFIIASATVGSGVSLAGINALAFNAAGNHVWVGDALGVLDIDLETQVRQRLLTTDFSVTDLALDSANNRLLLADRQNSTVHAMHNTTFTKTVFLDGSVGTGKHFDWARSVAYDAAGKYVYVGDSGYIHRVDIDTGRREILSGSGASLPGSVYDLYLDAAANQLYALGPSSLVRVNLANGDRTLVASSAVGSGVAFSHAEGVTADPASQLAWIIDYDLAAVIQINLATGERTIISDASRGQGPLFNAPFGIAYDTTQNRLLVSEGDGTVIFAVNIATGNRTVLSNAASQGPAMRSVREISMDPLRNRLLVVTGGGSSDLPKVLAVDLTSGNRVAVSLNGTPGSGPAFIDTQGISVDGGNHRVFVVDSGDGTGALLSISLATGDRVIVSQ